VGVFFVIADLGDQGLTIGQIQLSLDRQFTHIEIMIVTDTVTLVLQGINHDTAAFVAVADVDMATDVIIVTSLGSDATGKTIGWYRLRYKVDHAAYGLWTIQHLTGTLDHFNALYSFQRCGVVS